MQSLQESLYGSSDRSRLFFSLLEQGLEVGHAANHGVVINVFGYRSFSHDSYHEAH